MFLPESEKKMLEYAQQAQPLALPNKLTLYEYASRSDVWQALRTLLLLGWPFREIALKPFESAGEHAPNPEYLRRITRKIAGEKNDSEIVAKLKETERKKRKPVGAGKPDGHRGTIKEEKREDEKSNSQETGGGAVPGSESSKDPITSGKPCPICGSATSVKPLNRGQKVQLCQKDKCGGGWFADGQPFPTCDHHSKPIRMKLRKGDFGPFFSCPDCRKTKNLNH